MTSPGHCFQIVMHPLDITESDQWGDALPGMTPALPLKAHARRALRQALRWFRLVEAGKIVRTKSGDRRVMPYSLRLLARQYVYDQLDPDGFVDDIALQYARRYYVVAIEVELGNIVEAWAPYYCDDWPQEYQALVNSLHLENL